MRITPFSTECARKMIPNQFEVAIIGAIRMHELKCGAVPLIDPVDEETLMSIALREIAAGKIGREYLLKGKKHNDKHH